MIGIPCFLLREKTTQSYRQAQGHDGAQRGSGEKRLIACIMIGYAMPLSHHPVACAITIHRLAQALSERLSSKKQALQHSRHKTTQRPCLMRDTREMEARMVISVSLFEQEPGWS